MLAISQAQGGAGLTARTSTQSPPVAPGPPHPLPHRPLHKGPLRTERRKAPGQGGLGGVGGCAHPLVKRGMKGAQGEKQRGAGDETAGRSHHTMQGAAAGKEERHEGRWGWSPARFSPRRSSYSPVSSSPFSFPGLARQSPPLPRCSKGARSGDGPAPSLRDEHGCQRMVVANSGPGQRPREGVATAWTVTPLPNGPRQAGGSLGRARSRWTPPPPTPKTATCDRSLGQLSPAPGEPP